MMNDLTTLPKPFFVLAPMDEVTETVFRQIVQGCAPADLYFTEFVNVDGLQSPGRPKLLKKLRFTDGEGPLVAQLWGLKPENFEITAREIADGTMAKELGLPDGVNFGGIDINMGCPAKSEVQNGACSALIKNRPLAKEIIEATIRGAREGSRRLQQEAAQGAREERSEAYKSTVKRAPEQGNTAMSLLHVPMPVSVKTRLGFNEIDLSWHEFLLGFDITMLTVHGRTRKEMSKVPAHWDQIGEVVKLRNKVAPHVLIVGNGDVLSRKQGVELAKQYGWDGVMIGRGVFQDPFVFANETPWNNYSREQRVELLRHHVTLFEQTWGNERRYETLKKFAKVYISDFDGAKELREQIMATQDYISLLRILTESEDSVAVQSY